jgi:hypothetical protein
MMTDVYVHLRKNVNPGAAPVGTALEEGEPAVNLADTPPTLYVGTDGTVAGNKRVGPVVVDTVEPTTPLPGTIWANSTTGAAQMWLAGEWYGITSTVTTNQIVRATGLVLTSFDNTSTAQLNVSEALLPKSDGLGYIRVGLSSIPLDINISGLNGLDTGAPSSDNWYHVWLITNGVTPSAIFSLSTTDPVLPAGYDWRGYVGAIRYNSSSEFTNMSQVGRVCSTKDQLAIADGASLTRQPVNIANLAPPTALIIRLSIEASKSTGEGLTETTLWPLDKDLGRVEVSGYAKVGVANKVGSNADLPIIETGVLYYRVLSANDRVRITTVGWYF